MPYSIQLPDGSLVEDIPDEIKPHEAKAQILKNRPDLGSKDITLGGAASDLGAVLKSGIGSLLQQPGQLYGLATGDFSNTGLYGYGKELEAAGKAQKSEALQALSLIHI